LKSSVILPKTNLHQNDVVAIQLCGALAGPVDI